MIFRADEPATWRDHFGDVEIRFSGRKQDGRSSTEKSMAEVIEAAEGRPVAVAWCRQIHSDRVLEARAPGLVGDGDALWSDRVDLALAVATADCVPVLLAVGERIAAVHAGWRGVAARIVPKVIARLEAPSERISAWIGPAIGGCCYEVGNDVADQVIAACDETIVSLGPTGKPHLDLVEAVARQLTQAGVERIVRTTACTRCSTTQLWSYRRDGAGQGRNVAWIRRRG